MVRDPYVVLGIPRTATPPDIKKAYRDLCKKWHPDMPSGDRAKFEEVQAAFDSIYKPSANTSSAKKKYPAGDPYGFRENLYKRAYWRTYDSYSNDAYDAYTYSHAQAHAAFAKAFLHVDHDLKITFEEMCLGCERFFEIPRRIQCKNCAQPCGYCQEKGCESCHGTGKLHSTTCPSCRGAGSYTKLYRITLTIKPGVKSGTVVELKNMGHEGNNGIVGNVLVTITVGSHPHFKRRDLDIHSTEIIDVFSALMGGMVQVRTIRGNVGILLSECITNGHIEKIPLAGIDMEKQGHGHHYVKFALKMPKKMTPRQRELIQKVMEPEPEAGISRHA